VSGFQQLIGSFSLVQPSCSASQPGGSYFVVAYGDKAARNSSSSCVSGSYTLLPPGATGLPTGQFADVPTPTFDAAGDSLANSIVAPVPFNGHKLGMGTSPNDVQDAPQGPPTYAAPMALIEGRTLLVDLRPLFVTYNGRPGATCLTGWGVGCWEEGSKAAMGTYDPVSHRFTLDWRASQAFTGASAGISFHLEGSFAGQITAAPADAGADWRPDQYVLTGSSTQAGDVGGTGPAGGAGGLAVAPSSSGPQVGAGPTSASPLPSWLAAGHSSRRVVALSAVSGILVLLISAATVIIAGRRVPRS
jgi:hypothetical protein